MIFFKQISNALSIVVQFFLLDGQPSDILFFSNDVCLINRRIIFKIYLLIIIMNLFCNDLLQFCLVCIYGSLQ